MYSVEYLVKFDVAIKHLECVQINNLFLCSTGKKWQNPKERRKTSQLSMK